MITATQAREANEQYREEGYAIVRGFIDGDRVERLQKEARSVYEEGLRHHATYRNGNLSFQVLPESHFDKRYVLQAYWFSWINDYFEQIRRSDDYLLLLEGLLGRDIKQIAQQLHWKPPGVNVSGYRFHQDIRFRQGSDIDKIAASTVTTGLAVDRATKENGCLQVVPGSHKLSACRSWRSTIRACSAFRRWATSPCSSSSRWFAGTRISPSGRCCSKAGRSATTRPNTC